MLKRMMLDIDSSNTAVSTKEQLAEILRNVARKVENGQDGGTILDDNGNSVGFYEITFDNSVIS
jgi:hypothetical protein